MCVSIYLSMYVCCVLIVCMYMYTCIWKYVYGGTRVCMHMWHVCMGTCVSVLYVCVRVFVHAWVDKTRLSLYPSLPLNVVGLRVVAIRAHSPDPNPCSLWTRYTGNLKTDLWDDSEIRTSSCSENQRVIRFQNRVISCECLLLSFFLIYHYQ